MAIATTGLIDGVSRTEEMEGAKKHGGRTEEVDALVLAQRRLHAFPAVEDESTVPGRD